MIVWKHKAQKTRANNSKLDENPWKCSQQPHAETVFTICELVSMFDSSNAGEIGQDNVTIVAAIIIADVSVEVSGLRES